MKSALKYLQRWLGLKAVVGPSPHGLGKAGVIKLPTGLVVPVG
jgi:hypothetical protein